MKHYFTLLLLFVCITLNAQIVINELDSDTEGIDDLEFVELKTDAPLSSLDGYVLVFFNGSTSGNDSSYFTVDLNGFTSDVNGLFVIGNQKVSPVPQYIISDNTIQNGADAVAIYQGSYLDFPEGTQATTTNLIDALVYDTDDADDQGLMALLGVTEQINENENNNKDFESIQRANDGSYYVAAPTPRQLNDGSGIILNQITINVAQEQYNEGDDIVIEFSTDFEVETDLTFNFSLDNGSFDETDYTGITTLTIPQGETTVSTTISIIEDNINDGDEVMLISINSTLPNEFILANNNLQIRIIDIDFVVAAWGTPVNPTYDIVESTAPSNYYSSLNGKAGQELKDALQAIIAEEGVVRAQTYAEVFLALEEADQNPDNSNEVWLVYTEQGRAKLDKQTTSNSTGFWNREHVFPRSRGGFYSIEEDDFVDGIDNFWNTNVDSLRHGNSDMHHLRAVDGPENSSRGNQFYGPGQYTGPSNTQGSFRGDVARSIFYMAIRYNGLSVVNGYPESSNGEFGDLETLMQWHQNDPADDFEMNRNNVIYNWQINRNPFIDLPELVDYIWGDQAGNVWNQNLSAIKNEFSKLKIYPNPAAGAINFKGIEGPYTIEFYSVLGNKVWTKSATDDISIRPNLMSGVYLVKVYNGQSQTVKKIILK